MCAYIYMCMHIHIYPKGKGEIERREEKREEKREENREREREQERESMGGNELWRQSMLVWLCERACPHSWQAWLRASLRP